MILVIKYLLNKKIFTKGCQYWLKPMEFPLFKNGLKPVPTDIFKLMWIQHVFGIQNFV